MRAIRFSTHGFQWVLSCALQLSVAHCSVEEACAVPDGICDPAAAFALYSGFREVSLLVGSGQAGIITASYDGGQSWELRATLPTGNSIGAVAGNGAGTWVAVGGLNTDAEIYYSNDAGRVWHSTIVPASLGQLTEVIYNDAAGFFVAMGSGQTIGVSTDGISWEPLVISGVDRIRALIQVGSNYYVVGGLTPFVFLRSSDGIDWSPTGGLPGAIPFDLAGTEMGRFVTCGTLGARASFSVDGGRSWSTPTTSPGDPMQSVVQLDDQFLCAGTSGNVAISADGGDNWSTVATLAAGIRTLRLADDGAVVAAGDDGSFFRSKNGTEWTRHSLSISASIEDLNQFRERLFFLYGAGDGDATF